MEEPINAHDNQQIEQKPQEAAKNNKTKHLLKNKVFLLFPVLLIVIIVASILILSKDTADAPSPTNNESGKPETATGNTIIDKLYAAYPNDVIDTQQYTCEPRVDDEWYRTDHTLAIDPKNPDVMYISVEWKGIFKTIDGGKTWQEKTKGILAYADQADKTKRCFGEYPVIRINPSDSNHLILVTSGGGGGYLSLTEPNSQTGGIYQSLDGGDSWRMITGENMNIYSTDAAFMPGTGSSIFYATSSAPASWQEADQSKKYVTSGLILSSQDKGRTWAELPTGIGERTSVTKILINPSDTNQLIAPTFTAQRSSADGTGTGISDGKIITPNQLGILSSIDGGKTWTTIANSTSFPYVNAAASPTNFKNMYFTPFLGDSREQNGFVTTDGGVTLQKTKLFDTVAYDPFDASGNTVLGFTTMSIGPVGQNLTLHRSTDGGKTWSKYGTLPKEITDPNSKKTRPSGIVWHPTDKNSIYMHGAGGHVWKSTDSGLSWTTLLSVDKLPK